MQPASGWAGLLSGFRVDVSPGLWLLDSEDRRLEDLTRFLEAGSITRSGDDMGTCSLRLTHGLDWGTARVQPTVTFSDDLTSQTVSLGVYLTATPAHSATETPPTYEVQGYDKLLILDHHVPRTVSLPSGTNVLTTARSLIAEAGGGTRVLFAGDAMSVTLPAGKSWQLGTTYRTVIDELLATVGYDPLWCDWEGFYRSAPIVPPENQGAEWEYDARDSRTMVGEDRQGHADFYRAPNHWIVIADNPGLSVPTAGNGLVERVNQSVGKASVDARGRRITTVVRVDAANQAALEAQADKVLAEALRPDLKWSGTTAPNPLHWHRDVVSMRDDVLGVDDKFLVRSFVFDLFGADTQHREWQAL